MESLSKLVYSPLKEDESNTKGWNKDTVNFAINHKSTVMRYIFTAAKTYGKLLSRTESDEIYQRLLLYLYEASDYDINKAVQSSGYVVSLTNYVGACIKYCVVRELTQGYEHNSKYVDSVIKMDDGNEGSILESIEDDKTSIKDIMNIEEFYNICRTYEYYRYFQDVDIFQLWVIKLLCIKYKRDEDFYNTILSLFVNRKGFMDDIQEDQKYCEIMHTIASAIAVLGDEKALEVLKQFTYGYDIIEKAIKL